MNDAVYMNTLGSFLILDILFRHSCCYRADKNFVIYDFFYYLASTEGNIDESDFK